MKIILIFAAILLYSTGFAQYTLPKVTTTQEKATLDMVDGVSNENWYKTNQDGRILYGIIFRNTPVGVKHAFEKYYELRKEYETDNCVDNSMISSIAIKEDKSYDYEMLSLTIKSESSEIKLNCTINDTKIKAFRLVSSGGKGSFLLLLLSVNADKK